MAVSRFLFPRTITICRALAPASDPAVAVGKQSYQGVSEDSEAVVVTDVPASIQAAGAGKGSGASLPSDGKSLADWRILTPRNALPLGVVEERDIAVDDLGKRYQVLAAYWTPMGCNFRATLLQA